MRLLLALAVLAACGRSGRDDRACERTIEAASDRIAIEQRKSGVPGAGSALASATKLTMIASCEAEKWNDDVLRCIETTRLEVDLAACHGKLTHDQWESLQKKLASLRASLAPPDVIVSPPPDAALALVTVDAPPIDAPHIAPVDAMVIEAIVVDAPRAARVPPVDAGVREDCRRVLLNPTDRRCQQEYCSAHADDLRCQLAE